MPTPNAHAHAHAMQRDTKSRINAALAVAILVGHEENNPRLQLDEELVETLLEVLEAASQVRLCWWRQRGPHARGGRWGGAGLVNKLKAASYAMGRS